MNVINIVIFILFLLTLCGIIVWLIHPSDWVPPLIILFLLIVGYILYIVIDKNFQNPHGGVTF